MNKKAYIKPEQRIVELHHKTMLLAGSDYDSKQAPVDTYDDPITQKGDIW